MEKPYFDHCTFIKVRVRVQKRTDALGPVRILMVRNWDVIRALLEVLITKRSRKWEWRVCDRHGTTIMGGFESTRPAARYRGNWALFLLLSTRWAR
jgi:hypothetical protein